MPPLSGSPRRSTTPLRPAMSAKRSAIDTQMPAFTRASMPRKVRSGRPATSPGLPRARRPATCGPIKDGCRGEAMDRRKMTEAQRAYEAKRAAKAGLSLERWLERKEKAAAAGEHEAAASAKAGPFTAEAKGKPGFLAELLGKAQESV